MAEAAAELAIARGAQLSSSPERGGFGSPKARRPREGKPGTRMATELLKNAGVAVLRPNPIAPGDTATIIVVGVARSGTTMVGTALRKLGLHMGNRAHNPVAEDVEIASLLEGGETSQLKALIAEKNEQHPVWGFKRPEAFRLLPKYLQHFRNPRIVVTFRDPVAIAKRNEISMHMEFIDALTKASDATQELVRFVRDLDRPTLAVSYEKAMGNPDAFVEALCEFCGVSPDDEQRGEALDSIQNGPDSYLKSSRVWFEGRFDRVTNRIAHGWVHRLPSKTPCRIEVFSGGKCIGQGMANRARRDIAEKIGDRAFAVRLSAEPGDDVTVKVAGTSHVLARSERFRIEQK